MTCCFEVIRYSLWQCRLLGLGYGWHFLRISWRRTCLLGWEVKTRNKNYGCRGTKEEKETKSLKWCKYFFFFIFKHPQKKPLTCALLETVFTPLVCRSQVIVAVCNSLWSVSTLLCADDFQAGLFSPAEDQPIVCHLSKTTFLRGDMSRGSGTSDWSGDSSVQTCFVNL